MLSDLHYKQIYRSTTESLDKDFLIPALAQSSVYDRGTGFFTLAAFSTLANGLIPFLRNGGNVRIVTSVELSDSDCNCIRRGLKKAADCVVEELMKLVDAELNSELAVVNIDLLLNLIAIGRIEVKVAYVPDGGIYHEKIGFLFDNSSNCVFFSGSQNETHFGYRKNVETLTTFCSWRSEEDKLSISDEHEYFNRLWENNQDGIRVMGLPEAVKEKLIVRFRINQTVETAIQAVEVRSKPGKRLFAYQSEAIEAFLKNKCCHFYEMATGTGKTFTALKTIETVVQKKLFKALQIVILVPQVDLQEQWYAELCEMGFENIHLLGGGHNVSGGVEQVISDSIIECCISEAHYSIILSVYDTYFSKIAPSFNYLQSVQRMLVVDEAHGLTISRIKALEEGVYLARLGLSATPERGTVQESQNLIEFFTDGTVEPYRYTIDEAIKNNFLSHYEYYPIKTHMTEDEFALYQHYTKQIIVLQNLKNRSHEDEKKLKSLLNLRSFVVKKAIGKIHALRDMLSSGQYNFRNAVVYCGQGKDSESDIPLIDKAVDLLREAGLKVSRFTSMTSDRKAVLQDFSDGLYDTLVAIKCFDQGVDVPKLDKIYILSSDTTHRQTVQRRGRVLRVCKSTNKQMAFIYDMIVLPPEGTDSGMGVAPLLDREVARVREYARLADNREDSDWLLEELTQRYNLESSNNNDNRTDDE